jgi:hypothetical protein
MWKSEKRSKRTGIFEQVNSAQPGWNNKIERIHHPLSYLTSPPFPNPLH